MDILFTLWLFGMQYFMIYLILNDDVTHPPTPLGYSWVVEGVT